MPGCSCKNGGESERILKDIDCFKKVYQLVFNIEDLVIKMQILSFSESMMIIVVADEDNICSTADSVDVELEVSTDAVGSYLTYYPTKQYPYSQTQALSLST